MGVRSITADELLLRPDGRRSELVRGEVRAVTPAGFWHAEVIRRLNRRITACVERFGLGAYYTGEIGFWIERDPDTVRAPDGAFLRAERARALLADRTAGFVDGPPDLAIEVLSPTDRRRDAVDKCRTWIAAGARMAVLVDPERRTATTFSAAGECDLPQGGTLTFGDVIPDLAIALAELFE